MRCSPLSSPEDASAPSSEPPAEDASSPSAAHSLDMASAPVSLSVSGEQKFASCPSASSPGEKVPSSDSHSSSMREVRGVSAKPLEGEGGSLPAPSPETGGGRWAEHEDEERRKEEGRENGGETEERRQGQDRETEEADPTGYEEQTRDREDSGGRNARKHEGKDEAGNQEIGKDEGEEGEEAAARESCPREPEKEAGEEGGQERGEETTSAEGSSEAAREFCWQCLHSWLRRGASECPVCKGHTTTSNVIPIYGRGAEKHPRDAPDKGETAAGRIPERPRAERPEPGPQSQSSVRFGPGDTKDKRCFGSGRDSVFVCPCTWGFAGGTGGASLSFGLFPFFGLGVTWGGGAVNTGFSTSASSAFDWLFFPPGAHRRRPGVHRPDQVLTEEQQRMQSLGFLLLAFCFVLYIIFIA
ncbi:Zinc finger (C3HC4 RING finger) protein, related [Neospora caninum Liverpool]|uniref:RING-type E3 ubiquitin transferase n=1 Tax=Neospora caninum (strain Liverpool) TaxID=572307 RepID=F0VES2_NEOCL|nr:Zinc finger (C3HC4 RING finger) protein, related [Neospora caninum Liverpool]CBZ52216.1 Zinc finger (C3HC4 RING finger) protein, related [Neospora caninum Liverpool]|eukprot:XP_003882248.1 Zinc finger (C3HC4 RING finger) protein, related [Neospora caninum Liverpool]